MTIIISCHDQLGRKALRKRDAALFDGGVFEQRLTYRNAMAIKDNAWTLQGGGQGETLQDIPANVA